ncbi:MAG: hypothetical protein HY678_12455 [Chloroflexi bacterium]|nr:hypothetical protein [Chloroflexota bacterium]
MSAFAPRGRRVRLSVLRAGWRQLSRKERTREPGGRLESSCRRLVVLAPCNRKLIASERGSIARVGERTDPGNRCRMGAVRAMSGRLTRLGTGFARESETCFALLNWQESILVSEPRVEWLALLLWIEPARLIDWQAAPEIAGLRGGVARVCEPRVHRLALLLWIEPARLIDWQAAPEIALLSLRKSGRDALAQSAGLDGVLNSGWEPVFETLAADTGES